MTAEKVFHVSPFLNRSGYYRFKFKNTLDINRTNIDYYDNEQLMLCTSVYGKYKAATNAKFVWMLLKFPLMTMKVIFLIHYQAIRLFLKKIRFYSKPEQKESVLSIAKKEVGSDTLET